MISKLIKYTAIIYFYLVCSASAGTDLLSNALTQSNTFLKEAGNVQREYSKGFRKIATMKVDPDAVLGEKARAMKQKIEKNIDRANSLKEKAEKFKKVTEQAKIEAAELNETYNKLNKHAAEAQAKAEEALAKNQELQDKYKTGKKKLKGVLNTTKDIENKAKEKIDVDEMDNVPNSEDNADIIDRSDDSSDINVQENEHFRKIVDSPSLQYVPEVISAQNAHKPTSYLSKQLSPAEDETTGAHVFNQADAISFANSTANQVYGQNSIKDIKTDLDLDSIEQSKVSVSDVMSAINAPSAITSQHAVNNAKSAYNLKEQLEQTSNYIPTTKNNHSKIKGNNEEKVFELNSNNHLKELAEPPIDNGKNTIVEEKGK